MKYITVLLFCALGFASSCSNMLDQYSHSAIPPEAVTEKDLPALRLGMYNRVQNEPQTRSFIMCDILGGDITQSNYNRRQHPGLLERPQQDRLRGDVR